MIRGEFRYPLRKRSPKSIANSSARFALFSLTHSWVFPSIANGRPQNVFTRSIRTGVTDHTRIYDVVQRKGAIHGRPN